MNCEPSVLLVYTCFLPPALITRVASSSYVKVKNAYETLSNRGSQFIGSAVVRHNIRDTQDAVINLDNLTCAGWVVGRCRSK